MKLSKLGLLRCLNLVSVFGINQIVISAEGNVCHPAPDRTIIVYGNTGLKDLDEEWVLPDIELLNRIVKSMPSDEVDIVRDKNSFKMESDNVQWKYRLGNKEVIQTTPVDIVEDLIGSLKIGVSVPTTTMKKLSEIENTLKAPYLRFVSKEGKLQFVVGEEENNSGSLEMNQDLGAEFALKIKADRFVEIVDRIDSPNVDIKFGIETKKYVQIAMPGFSWIIGGVKELE